MKKTRLFVFFLLIILLLFSNTITAYSQEKIEINFFHSNTCSHCEVVKDILARYEKNYPDFSENIVVNYREMRENNNRELIKSFYEAYNVPEVDHGKVPITFIGNKYILGETTFEQEFLVYYNTYLEKRDLYNEEFAPIKNIIQKASLNNSVTETQDIEENKDSKNNNTVPIIIICVFSIILLISISFIKKSKKGMR